MNGRKLTGRAADLAQIHIAQKALGMPEASYRTLLRRLTGQDSAAKLNAAERRRVIDRFIELGWKPSRPRTAPSGAPAQRRKIARMLESAGRPARYAEAIARRMHGRPLAHCSQGQLSAVIAALDTDRRRRAAREGATP